MLEIAGIAGLLSTALGIGELARRKILGSRLEHSLEVQHSVQAWRVLRSPSDFSEALDRAIASDRESIRLYERRAIRYEALQSNRRQRQGTDWKAETTRGDDLHSDRSPAIFGVEPDISSRLTGSQRSVDLLRFTPPSHVRVLHGNETRPAAT